MRKTVVITLKVDEETAQLLRCIAESEYDGNKSMTVRRIVKDAARERGIVADKERETA